MQVSSCKSIGEKLKEANRFVRNANWIGWQGLLLLQVISVLTLLLCTNGKTNKKANCYIHLSYSCFDKHSCIKNGQWKPDKN